MSRIFFAFAETVCAWAARWLFFWPGDRLTEAAGYCHARAAARPEGEP